MMIGVTNMMKIWLLLATTQDIQNVLRLSLSLN